MNLRVNSAAISRRPSTPLHHFTIDVEEYYQVSAFEDVVSRSCWTSMESRVVASTRLLLDLLDETNTRSTCFVLGCVAEQHPDLVREISRRGHEVASHGWDHRRITEITPDAFRASIRESKSLLEELTGEPVLGFRAPSFSIVHGREWALELLAEEGYRYDSSLFPIRRSTKYGYAGAPRDPYWLSLSAGRLAEFPPATLHRLGASLPAAGGAYFRLLPYALVRMGLRDCERRQEHGTFYIHPWELDPDQPRLGVPPLTRLRHYGGLRRTADRVRRLLREFRFQPMRDSLREMEPSRADSPALAFGQGVAARSAS